MSAAHRRARITPSLGTKLTNQSWWPAYIRVRRLRNSSTVALGLSSSGISRTRCDPTLEFCRQVTRCSLGANNSRPDEKRATSCASDALVCPSTHTVRGRISRNRNKSHPHPPVQILNMVAYFHKRRLCVRVRPRNPLPDNILTRPQSGPVWGMGIAQ